ncbi:MAG: hypothetical protein FJW09_00800 [Actinobacteria bacterium]|nr:hypothetical protein [Actinomycetota bacterium]
MNDDDSRLRERLVEIVGELRDLVARLDDLQFDLLREASERHQPRPAMDKTLSQARRALEKALNLLGD